MNKMSLFAAMAACAVAVSAQAQTLKMEPQVVGVTTYEASTAVNLVVVKPEVKIDLPSPDAFTVNTNGTERNVISVYPSRVAETVSFPVEDAFTPVYSN